MIPAKITIAVGGSRKAKQWKNKELSWPDILDKLRVTTRTRESAAEYAKLSKSRQDEIKDVGGFVGGYIKNGRRIAGNVVKRQLVTLDADFADSSFMTILDLVLGDVCYAVYSTHKHTPEKPRLRVVIPLVRAVQPDAYQAIARRIADDIGMDLFDDTTYEAERLMHWPSTSADGEYVFFANDSENCLDPDDVLAAYDDWRDTSTWPESSRANKMRQVAAKKQGDPYEKPGAIGAFCRTYSVQDAIDCFLNEVYEPCSEGRYTYKQGSTSGGLVVYEDGKFAYSHHGTDPVSGKLVNSFDLVRLHLFGDKDADVEVDTKINNLPSYGAMQEFAMKDDAVKTELAKKLLEESDDFGDVPADIDWMSKLEMTPKTGEIKSTPYNLKLILENDINLVGKVAYNDFSFRTVLLDSMPWRSIKQGVTWNDTDDSCLRNYLSNVYGVKGQQVIYDACAEVFTRNHFHPVRDYIKATEWDGTPRVDTLWIDYLGADDTDYVRTVTRKHLVAAVARVFSPGCKFDNVIILCGPQGIGKSTMLKKLGREWFSDSLTSVQGKEAYEQLHGVWIAELGELYATRKAESEAVKQFLSKSEDIFRVAYGRRTASFPRQCVFYGTTNETVFLRDRTGNRRFWPVNVGGPHDKSFKDFTESEVAQVWAEAYYLWQQGESLYLDKDMEAEAAKAQSAHTEESEKVGLVREYLDTLLPENWDSLDLYERRDFLESDELTEPGTVQRYKVCVLEIWCEVFKGDPKNLNSLMSREINSIMQNMQGWDQARSSLRFGKMYGTQRAYVRKTI